MEDVNDKITNEIMNRELDSLNLKTELDCAIHDIRESLTQHIDTLKVSQNEHIAKNQQMLQNEMNNLLIRLETINDKITMLENSM